MRPQPHTESNDLAGMSPSNLTSDQRARTRLILLLATPLAASILLSTALLTSVVISSIDREAESFGQVMAEQLAVSSTEYILAGDLLSLNVLLANLVEQEHIKGASIYSADNRLLVEAGEASVRGDGVFTAEIHYQDSIAGYIRVALDRSGAEGAVNRVLVQIALANVVLLFAVLYLLRRYAEPIVEKLLAPTTSDVEAGSPEPATTTEPPSPETGAFEVDPQPAPAGTATQGQTLLVMKLKPARLAREIEPAVAQAIGLYQGEIIGRQEEEWTAQFLRGGDHCFQAICAGLVIQRLCTRRSPELSFDGGIHCGESAQVDDARATSKQAIYLASLGSGKLLATSAPFSRPAVIDRVEISEYHSFLAPDSQVFAIDALKEPYQGLIERQAQKLTSERSRRGEGRNRGEAS